MKELENELTKRLSWQDMIHVWNRNWEYVEPITLKRILWRWAGLITASLLISGFVVFYLDYLEPFTTIHPPVFTLIGWILIGVFSSWWYLTKHLPEEKKNKINAIKDSDSRLDTSFERIGFWINGYISLERLEKIKDAHELGNCITLLKRSEYFPIKGTETLFREYMYTLLQKANTLPNDYPSFAHARIYLYEYLGWIKEQDDQYIDLYNEAKQLYDSRSK